MRYSVVRFRASMTLAALALISTALSGCGRLSSSSNSHAFALLKSGSEQVCTDTAVQSTLRSSLLPALSDLPYGSDEEKQKALDAVSFSYATTTLGSFDNATSKATCDTVLTVHGPSNSSSDFHISYSISPSADQSGSFVVTAESSDARAYVFNLIATALPQTGPSTGLSDAMDNDAAPAVPNVDEAALVGVWIKTGQTGASCRAGSAVVFQSDHVLTGGLGSGRWALTGNTLHIVTDARRTADVSANIVAADAISLTLSMPGNSVLKLRRCSNEDLQAPAAQPSMDENKAGVE